MAACNQRESQDIETISFPIRSDDRHVLVEANIRSQSRSNEAILLSTTADRSYLFKASNDCMILILSYLSMKDICQLDIAVTNTTARVIWLSSLEVTNHHTINEYTHSNGSIRWLVGRGIRLVSLKVKNVRCFTHSSALLGLNVSLLRDVTFSKSNIGDEEVIMLAHESPYLSDICLYDCQRVTNAGVIALAKSCVHLLEIDIGNCMKITDDGLVAFTSGCSNVRTANLLDRSDIYNLRKIRLDGCTNVTDIGI